MKKIVDEIYSAGIFEIATIVVITNMSLNTERDKKQNAKLASDLKERSKTKE